jgi:hypothetical protein
MVMRSLALATSVAYMGGFLVTFAWARSLHRRHRLGDRRAAIAPALMGGALGGTCVLVIFAAQQSALLTR